MMILKKRRNYKSNNKVSIHRIEIWLIIAIGFIYMGCGISDIPVYSPPYINLIAPGVISITHNTTNNIQSFIGYKIYYKLYEKNDITTISSDKDYITDTTRTPYPSTMTSKKFRELVPVNFDGSKFQLLNRNPLIKQENKSSSTVYYLDFSTGTQEYQGKSQITRDNFIAGSNNAVAFQALLIESSNITILHRNLDNSQHKSFFNEKGGGDTFIETDEDIKNMLKDPYTSNDQLQIVFAIIPYGIDFLNLQKIYGSIVMTEETLLEYTITPQ